MRVNGHRRLASREALLYSGRLPRLLAACASYAVAMLVLYTHLVLWPQQFREGQIAPYTIFAPVSFIFTDPVKLKNLTGATGSAGDYSVLDPAAADTVQQNFTLFEAELLDLRAQCASGSIKGLERDNAAHDLELRYGLRASAVTTLLDFSEAQLTALLAEQDDRLASEMSRTVTADYVQALKREANEAANSPDSLFLYFLQSNLKQLPADEMLQQRSRLAQEEVLKGSVVVAEGALIDERVMSQLEALAPHLLEQNIYRYLGLGLLLLAAALLCLQYMTAFAPRLVARTGSILQLGTLFMVLLAAGLLLGRLQYQYFYYSVTFAVAAMATIVVLVYDSVLALYLGLSLGLILSLALGFGAHLTLYTTAGALLPAVYLNAASPHRRQVLFAFSLGALNTLMALMVILISVQTMHWQVFVIAFASGFASAIVALGLLPVIETLTSQLTLGKLFELANLENELLRRLKREALGTFVHSQMVADLAEEAVKQIGGDWLLARVGALYHDIGKLHRPGFFAENIHDLSKNPHQNLPPETSVRILKDHVADGLSIAREARLPRELHRFIGEHHGTYLIKFFYYTVCRQHEEKPDKYPLPDPRQFSYDGPLPQTRESGVVMLADVTEAMTRSRPGLEAAEMAQLVEQIVSDKLEELQLIESGLTIGDLQHIKAAFVRVLSAQRHHRVSYPSNARPQLHFHFLPQELAGATAAPKPEPDAPPEPLADIDSAASDV
jgi:cyclic-di-AMP phosphodiesterase PgpH